MPAGTSSAVRTIPAIRSRGSQDRWYTRRVWRPGSHRRAPADGSTASRPSVRLLAGAFTMQGFLELALRLVRQRALEDGAAVLGHRLHGLVRGHLFDDHEEGRGARLKHVPDLVLELLVHGTLGDLAHQRPHPGPDGHAEERDEEQHAEQHAPEHPPGRPGAHRVVVGDDPDLSLLVPDDRRHRVGLDDKLMLQPLGLIHRRQRGGLVRVPDRDQVRHLCLLAWSSASAAGGARRFGSRVDGSRFPGRRHHLFSMSFARPAEVQWVTTSLSRIIMTPKVPAMSVTANSRRPCSWDALPPTQPCTSNSAMATTSATVAAVLVSAPRTRATSNDSSGTQE